MRGGWGENRRGLLDEVRRIGQDRRREGANIHGSREEEGRMLQRNEGRGKGEAGSRRRIG